MPHSACGPCRLALNSNDVTAPKLPPPPPARPRAERDFPYRWRGDRVAGLARGPAEAAAHGETPDAGIGHDPARNHQTERLRLVIDVAPGGAAFDANDAARRTNAHAAPQAHVNHQAAVTERGPCDVVTAAADRQRQTVLAREVHAGDDVRIAAHPRDQGGPLRDHRVPD